MVLPLIAAGLGAAGSIAGGIMGANATESANKTNQMINIMNAMMRERERIDQMEQAGLVRREDKLGGIDADGNVTMFVPGKGWVVTPSTKYDEIQQLQRKEQTAQLYNDLPLRRRVMEQNYADQLQDREEEEKYLKELKYAKVNPDSIRAMLFQDANSGIQGSFDESTAAALRGVGRRGGDASAVLSKFARERADATGDAFAKTGVQALEMANNMSKSNIGQLQNLINFFGGRARGLPAVQFSKDSGGDQITANGNNSLRSFLSSSQNSEGMLTDAAGKQGGKVDYITPNLGYANTMVQGGQALGNLFKAFGRQEQTSNRWE